MTGFRIHTQINLCKTFNEFIDEFSIKETDLILTDKFLYDKFILPKQLPCNIIIQDEFGGGEPTDTKVKKILGIAGNLNYDRVIAIGGGTCIDISKIVVLSDVKDLLGLFQGKISPKRERKLIIVPTTCGTGSEITNISIVAFEELGTKIGLAKDEIFADTAVLIPEFLYDLPYKVFAFSSVDALIHAIESYLSPNSSEISRFFSEEAIRLILNGYKDIKLNGKSSIKDYMEKYLLASTYAGIAFSNAGCGLIHAMSYPLSGEYHLPHGEANHQMLMAVMRYYDKENPDGDIKNLYSIFADILDCSADEVLVKFKDLVNSMIERKPLSSFGADEEYIKKFSRQVVETQRRLLKNAYIPTDETKMYEIYKTLL